MPQPNENARERRQPPPGAGASSRRPAEGPDGPQARSKRSAFITFVQAATKSLTNFSLESLQA